MTTTIEWTDETWNPVTGCTKVSPGCKNCYAEKVFPRAYSKDQWPVGDGTFRRRYFTDVECHEDRVFAPLSWKRPRRVFVNSMSDLFHEDVPDEFIDYLFAVMAVSPQHTFQVLTKRPVRMQQYLSETTGPNNVLMRVIGAAQTIDMPRGRDKPDSLGWPYRNIWLGVSVENQATAKERIWPLLTTPAARRFVSYEPALGPVDLDAIEALHANWRGHTIGRYLDWVIVGGESGRGARPFNIQWARNIVEQCRRSETPVFVKQLGARPYEEGCEVGSVFVGRNPASLQRVRDRKGKDMSEWPEDLRVREWPCA